MKISLPFLQHNKVVAMTSTLITADNVYKVQLISIAELKGKSLDNFQMQFIIKWKFLLIASFLSVVN